MTKPTIFREWKQTKLANNRNSIMKFLCLGVFFFICITNIHAQKNAENDIKEFNKIAKTAAKYRSDISKDVLKRIKDWDKPAILHGDYIENQNGRSLNLQGDELDFGIDYIGLKPLWYQLYEITSPTGEKGIVSLKTTTGGEIYTPVKYDRIENCGHDGFFLGYFTKDGVEKVDVISLWGKPLITILNPKDIRGQYFQEFNQFLISNINAKEPSRSVFVICYPDGEFVSKGFYAEKAELHGSYILVTDSGKTKRYTDSKYGTVEHKASGLPAPASKEKLAYSYLFTNKWIDQALYYFKDKRQYNKAIECLDYFERYDAPRVDYRFTYAGAMYVRIRMLSYHNARRYTELLRYVREQNPLFSPSTFGLYFNPETDSFFDMTQFITEEDNRRAESINYLNECNDLYRRSYDNIVRQQQEEVQQAQAIAGVISNALSTISNGLSGSSGGSTATRQNNRVANNRSNSSSSSSSSSGNDTSSPTRHTCPRCDGKGKIEVEHNVNGGLQKRMKTCSECGKTYDSAATGHHHERCNSCRGLGYYEIK